MEKTTNMKAEQTNIKDSLHRRILILDGAMGTRIQALGLGADSYHRGRFEQWPVALSGNNDVLCLTAPEVIADIHRRYIEAGADIITTNTFSANRISQRDYHCEDIAREMAFEGARIARATADGYSLTSNSSPLTSRKIWVAGSMGPTNRSLSLPSDMSAPGERAVSFDEMVAAYEEQAEALIEGGADLLLLETCFDALNAKAALYAILQINERHQLEIPVMVSATVNDRSGRTLTGQTLEAFFISIAHYPYLLSFGLNCSFGVADLRPFIEQIAAHIPLFVSIYPNAGLPNEMGEYDEMPQYTASHLRQMAEAGLLNIAGGCCGTDEQHIKAISEALKDIQPRQVNEADDRLWTSGLEALVIDRQTQNFTNIGERTNVAGSRKFARLIAEKKYDEALAVARHQIAGGASVIDINMDDAMLDSRQEMQTFCRYVSSDPAVARAVLMIDSSDWPTVLAGLKNAQGKCIVNSISLKEGERVFLDKARQLRQLGAAVVVMAFDEEGQATTYERKIAVAERAYRLLTGIGFPPQDIIFDVNILSVATGISEHQTYAVDFIRAVAWIKQHLPQAKTSGGVSNLSFSFRGNNKVREAMHSVFLYHAIRNGLDMAIVNPAMLQPYDAIDAPLLKAVEDVILNSDDGATERLITLAAAIAEEQTPGQSSSVKTENTWHSKPLEERLQYALVKGDSEHLKEDMDEALQQYGRPIDVIEQPLMQAMKHIGQLFGEGKMFLPQVVKSAQVMKEAVALLQPAIDAAEQRAGVTAQKPCVVLATANGDVHDIGKNIVGIVMACNGFEVIDLGVMVANEVILEAARRHKPVLVGISGLITPSLKEMEQLCQLFQREGLTTPILVGGATTSAVHTAVRLSPLYDGLVVYGGDASQTSVLAKRIELEPATVAAEVRSEQQLLRTTYEANHAELVSYDEANRQATHFSAHNDVTIKNEGVLPVDIPLRELEPLIDWRMFLLFWGFKGETMQQLLVNPEAEKTLHDGQRYLQKMMAEGGAHVRQLAAFEPAVRQGNDIVLASDGQRFPMLRSQSKTGHFRCMADYFDTSQPSTLGYFVVTAEAQPTTDDGERLMRHALCARLAEAGAEWLQQQHYGQQHTLRAAFGYASCPDHSLKRIVFDRLQAEQRLGIVLNDHYSILPSTSVCGLFVSHPEARYFSVGRIDRSQLTDYCRRRGISLEEGERLLSKNIEQ